MKLPIFFALSSAEIVPFSEGKPSKRRLVVARSIPGRAAACVIALSVLNTGCKKPTGTQAVAESPAPQSAAPPAASSTLPAEVTIHNAPGCRKPLPGEPVDVTIHNAFQTRKRFPGESDDAQSELNLLAIYASHCDPPIDFGAATNPRNDPAILLTLTEAQSPEEKDLLSRMEKAKDDEFAVRSLVQQRARRLNEFAAQLKGATHVKFDCRASVSGDYDFQKKGFQIFIQEDFLEWRASGAGSPAFPLTHQPLPLQAATGFLPMDEDQPAPRGRICTVTSFAATSRPKS